MFALVLAAALAASPVSESKALASQAPDLSAKVLALGLRAYAHASAGGDARKTVLAIIDYSKPSTEKRLWIFDLASGRLLFHELVAHGRGSGDDRATRFSNRPQSLESSLGVFTTGETYLGKHGLSLKLRGLERGFNDEAEARAVVIHGADYVSEAFARAHGRLGRSWGCPAVASAVAPKVIGALRGGAVVFAYYPDARWLDASAFLR